MATTKTQAFNNKIKALKDYHTRLVSGVGGIPSSSDIQATLKFFYATLKGILKETTNIANESYGSRGKDAIRISLFPTFHYGDLFYLIIGLCEYVNKLNNQAGVCEAILKTFHVLIPFLEFDDLDMLPLIVTSCINLFPASQHPAIIELLCTAVIPFVYSWNEDTDSYAVGSIPSILQIVFQHIDKPEYHSWVVESLMSKKRHFWKDLILLIAFGSTESRIPATCLLFYYWPELVPMQFQSSQSRFPSKYHHETWKPILCERTDCPNKTSKIEAKKMSFEPHIAAMYGNKVPPLYLCLDCFDSLSRSKITNLYDVVLPIKSVKITCESKTCRSKSNSSYVTCYSFDCTSLNGNKPIRFCETCHIQKHLGAQCKKHIFQQQIPDVWDCSIDIQPTLVEAIISLCIEVNPRWRQQMNSSEESTTNQDTGTSGYTKYNLDAGGTSSMLGVIKSFASFQDNDIPLSCKYGEDDQKIISLYATFLIGEKCSTKPNTNIEILSRIVSGLFHWFLDTSYEKGFGMGPDGIGDFIEKIKRDYILKWILQVVENNLEVVLMVLLPYPMEYAKVGTCWDSLCDRSTQVKDGLQKIYSLIPYDVITFETWDYIVPFWLETMRTEINESEYGEFQSLLKKIFDQHAGPFPFLPAKLYNFATQRFTSTSLSVKDQVLSWLDILTTTKVVIPMKELLTMFSDGVKSINEMEETQVFNTINTSDINRSNSINSNDPPTSQHNQPITKSTNQPLMSQDESISLTGSDMILNQQELLLMMLGQSEDVGDFDPSNPSGVGMGPMGTVPLSGATSDSCFEQQYSILSCFCMMLKTTSLQLRMNDPHGHGNMSQETPTLTLGLLCDMLQTNWGQDKCRNRPSTTTGNVNADGTNSNMGDVDNYCVHCQDSLEWHQLVACILQHIVPINATALPEISMNLESLTQAANKKESVQVEKASIVINVPPVVEDPPPPEPIIEPMKDNENQFIPLQEIPEESSDMKQEMDEDSNETIGPESKSQDEREESLTDGDGVTANTEEDEDKEFDVTDLTVDLKLVYLLIRELQQWQFDPEITDSILKSVNYLIRHAELLKVTDCSLSATATPQQQASALIGEKKNHFIDFLLQYKLVPILWDLLTSEFSFLSGTTVPLLLHCLTVKSGANKFWSLLDNEFTNDNWSIRFDAVERVTILARNIDNTMIVENHAIITSLAHAFCNLIGSLDDVNAAVVTRTNFYLETIKEKSLACIVKCLEFQFDSVIVDRTLILLRMYQLSWALPGRSVFSWDFFINRFGIFSIEAQLGNNINMDINNVTDLNNQKGVSEFFRQQYERARIAVSRTDSIRTISGSSGVPLGNVDITAKSGTVNKRPTSEPNSHQPVQQRQTALHAAVQPLVINKPAYKPYLSQESKQNEDNSDWHYHRPSTAPPFSIGRRKSKPLLPGLGGLNVAEYTDPNNRFLTNIQEALDLEGSSRDTLHQWVTLLLKFMANVDMQISKDELKEKKALSKVQRHLALLLGYTEQSFNIPPYKLRNSTVFHAFISNIAQVMDRNFSIGNSILHQTLVVLQYCASPQRYASDSQPATFSLWLLEPQTRLHWLNTLLVILYKYEYNASGAGSGVAGGFRAIVDYLVRVSINTVENHLHVCKKTEEDGYSPPTPHMPRPRDTSNVSVDVDALLETDSPPSPTGTFGDSLNLSRTSRSNTLHYAKKDKELEILTSRFTSPVIKKKVARQYRGRSTVVGNLYSPNQPSVSNNAINSTVQDQDQLLPSTTVGIDSANNEDEEGGMNNTVVKEIILAPITVSSDEKVIKPPVLEENAGESRDESAKKNNSDNVENKMEEQLSQFALEAGSSKANEPVQTTITISPAINDTNNDAAAKESTIIEEKEKSEDESDSADEKPNYRQRKSRKSGLISVEIQKTLDTKEDPGRRRPRRSEMSSNDDGICNTAGGNTGSGLSTFYHRPAESFMVERCKKCHAVMEHYDEETLGLAIVCFGAYVHREPALAAPCLYDMLVVAAKIASHNMYSWRINLPNIVVPGNLVSIARQFLRCTLYNLYPNGLFLQLFQTEIEYTESFFKCMVSVLLDFEDHLNLFQPIHQVLEGLNKKKAISSDNIAIVIENLAAYLEALPINLEDSKDNHLLASWWMNVAPQFDQFLHKLQSILPSETDVGPILRMLIVMIRANMMGGCKSLMDTFATLLKFVVENCNLPLPPILELCSMTNRLYKEKGKSLLTKCLIEELHSAIKFKTYIPDKNLLMLIQFVLMDVGGTIEPNKICEGVTELFNPATYHILNTGSAELMRQHLGDCITFLSDVHTVHKVKQNQKLSGSQSLHEDTLGSHLKSAIAQYVALELSSSSSSRISYSNTSGGQTQLDIKDSPIAQYMPWLKSIPPATQQGPREFILCVERVRTLNWLLLGSMIHTSVTGNSTGITCQPIPLGFNKSVADLVKVILSGFPDQQKTNKESKSKNIDPVQSVIVMSSLYHAFVLCQLWTMYCETAASLHPTVSQAHQDAVRTALEFWMTILPTILHLLTISDDFVVVNGHLLTIMEELIECRSMTVAKVINWWTPILLGRNKQLPGNLHKRLQKCIECEPPQPETLSSKSELLIRWLKKHVFVLGRNEDQHSAATHIFVQ